MKNWEALKAMSEGRAVRTVTTRAPFAGLMMRIVDRMFESKTVSGGWKSSQGLALRDTHMEWELVEAEWEEIPARDVIARMEDEPGLEWQLLTLRGVWADAHPTLIGANNLYRCRPVSK